ncbi:MAG: ORF6N domain-containing protein, partial [Bacteroidota bacterium]|nr:ORF6N domain-containing protein [Bacteroidota bacterium]
MKEIIKTDDIQNRIITIRGKQVMLGSDLAELYGVEVKRLNEQVKRNIERFPEKFRFQLTRLEDENLKSQFATSSVKHGGKRTLSYVFTEQGVAMLSAVLKSKTAIKVSIQIMDAFVEMKKFLATNATVFQRLDNVERKQIETDQKFEQLFNALETSEITPKQNIFYDGQIFDAYTLIADIIRSAKKSIILIDNYVDDTVFKQLAKRNNNVTAVIYSKATDKIVKQDLQKHNKQYPKIELKNLTTAHDRFLIIDSKTVYHFGASLKDAGKKWFACSK